MTFFVLNSSRWIFRLKTEWISVFHVPTYDSIFSGVIPVITVKEFGESNFIRIIFWKFLFIDLYYALYPIELFTLILMRDKLIS